MSEARQEVVYVGDPMCSWCYGFAPALQQLVAERGEHFELAIIVGGLRPFTTEPMGEQMCSFLEHHWDEVARRSGQAFNKGLLKNPSFVYDTEPACRAVVAVRQIAPAKLLDFFAAVQRAFYAENLDPALVATYESVCAALDIDYDSFKDAFESGEVRAATRSDFELTQDMGVRGFPTVLGRSGERFALLAGGYVETSDLISAFDEFRSAAA